jgi:uncharacterized protein (TIGR02284 family)
MKPMQNSEVTSVVRDLIQTLEDGREGFRLAADAIDNSDLKKLFTHYSEQHARFATDLHNLSNGFVDPGYDQHGSLEGIFHRGWLNLRSAISANDPSAILTECERGEECQRIPESPRSVSAHRDTTRLGSARPGNHGGA